VSGWLHCESFTEPEQQLLQFSTWRLRWSGRENREVELLASRAHGKGWVVKVSGVSTPEQAAQLTGGLIEVPRAALPPVSAGEYYRCDLIGLEVRNADGRVLGRVDHFVDLPANAAMVVVGEREVWLPVSPQHLLEVNLAAGWVRVDWPEAE
jgi:16S rRNA processing protein RimM